jgi:hypothetical protein
VYVSTLPLKMALPIPTDTRLGRKLMGRPRNSGTPKKPEKKSTVSCRISPELYELVECQRANYETISDTIMRMLTTTASLHNEARKKANALDRRLEELRSLLLCRIDVLNNEDQNDQQNYAQTKLLEEYQILCSQ